MRYFIFFIFLLAFTSGNSQNDNVRPFDFQAYESKIKTIDFIVLDINFADGLLAFKHVYEILGYYHEASGDLTDAPVNCHYSGMEKHPFAGVILGVYDLNSQTYDEIFHIYQSVSNDEDCLSFDESEHNLEFAKEYFLSKNLNVENKPKALLFSKDNSLVLKPENISIKGSCKRVLSENDNADCFAEAALTADGDIIYTVSQTDISAMASGGQIIFISAFRKNDKIVFLERFHHYSHMGGFSDSEFFNFTKIYDITKF